MVFSQCAFAEIRLFGVRGWWWGRAVGAAEPGKRFASSWLVTGIKYTLVYVQFALKFIALL